MFKFYYLVSWLREHRNVPPEPLFSLCHLVGLFFLFCLFFFPLLCNRGAEKERQHREKKRGEGGQIALSVA